MKIVIFFLSLLYINLLSAQSLTNESYLYNSEIESKGQLSLPHIDIHAAAGIIQGARLGVRYLFLKNYSFEIAYGNNVLNFITLSDFQRRYSLGMNYHFDNSDATLSLLTTYVEQPGSVYEALLFSPTFGFIPIKKTGFFGFFRVGIGVKFIKNFPHNNWKIEDLEPNLDLGISLVF